MSKIDEFNRAKDIYNRVKHNLYKATSRNEDGQNDPINDKGCLTIRYSGQHTPDWHDAILALHASHGYYGSFSCYSDMDEQTAKYMIKALNNNLRRIADEAIELARKDMEAARKAAKDEAELVLRETDAQESKL